MRRRPGPEHHLAGVAALILLAVACGAASVPDEADAEQRAAGLVPRRTERSPWAPLTSMVGSAPVETSLGRTYQFEARSFADGSRSILDIRNAISAEFGPVALEEVTGFFRDLEKTGNWTIQELMQ